ncbi:putative DNA excision repair protein [Leishmania major strain Friedlin]|uniref:Putative DNA excision repair protein n=1 Tax=Leishmania major TaxID=5664 RepID=Q4QFP9_LEIMA|nr:putative DNA excision repair protein [Leishmania major strain Friedlin]CAG9571273.1 SNF2_family_helicase-like_protein_-_putative [Leishmania major strain Friedlin]CAJ03082.1 putative DNA excision repair protein [Leishmania major strain Friedlin]|eukprot:XP_001687685.1 putative DNA excision repair protein [Leishmania major strain Friedlin]
MADDLASLQQRFGVFQDEEEMRMDVAARVVAQSSREALEDEERLKKSWRELEKAEHAVGKLQLELSEAQLAAAQESSGLLGDAQRNKSSGPATPSPRRVSDIRFQLNAAERELKRADAAVQKLQKEVDQRQAARLAEAKRLEQEDEAERAAADVTRVVRANSTTGRPVPLASSSSTIPPRANTSVNGGALAGGSLSASSPTVMTTTRVLYRAPTHLKGITQSDYSGGEVLPSLSRVQVTRADIRSKQRRYQDDSEMQRYVERVTKRQRLEAVAKEQRRLVALGTDGDAPSQSLSSSIEKLAETRVKAEGEQDGHAHQVKQEPGGDDVAGALTPAAAAAAKARAATKEAEGGERTRRLPRAGVKVETEEEEGAHDVIDVDALMEADDDAAVAAVVSRASTQLTGGYTQRSGKATPSTSLSSQQQQQQRERAGSASSTTVSASEEVVWEMEEATLLPGVRMDAAIYNRLLDYQQEGLLWLLTLHSRRTGGILGDEMGLGKTIQVAVMINALHHSGMLRGPVLIAAPMTVLRQWLAELHRWAPYVRSCVMHESSGSDTTRDSLLQSVQGTPAVVITTYAAMRVHCGLLHRTGFQYVILDEGHKISNPEAGATLAAKSFTTPHRLILSGSPIQNSLKELWCLFDFVRPGLLGTMSRFIDEFETPIAQSRNARASPLSLATAVECAKALQAHIAPYMLRRLKRQVNTSLPPKYERVLRVPLADKQLDQYLQVLSSPAVQRLFAQTAMFGSRNGGLDRDGRDSTGSLHVAGLRANMASRRHSSGVRLESFRLMNQLRQICNHADIYAVQQGADEEDRMMLARRGAAAKLSAISATRPGQHRSFRSNNPVDLLGSGKLNALLMMLKEWQSFGHRVLVFSQTRIMLDIIENMCEQQAYSYIRMDGATNSHYRQELMDRFNEDDSIFVALLTTRVGGIGVNLIGADRVVIYDPDWNPITDVQARERAWRIGQKREVCVYRLITSGSVEESILRRQLAKMYVTDKVLKDPELQRFFDVQDGFMESFLLGSEYANRVPVDKRYLLAAHHLNSVSAGNRDRARGRDRHAALGEYGNAVPGVDDDDDTDTDMSEGNMGVAGSKEEQPRKERDFGMLVPLKNEDGIDEVGADPDDTGGAEEDGSPVGIPGMGDRNKKTSKGKEVWRETQMLQKLVDCQDVSVAGHDRVAHHLARKKAEDMMRRVSSSALTTEAMREQQRQYSLLQAIGEKKAKDAADREEKARYYREEIAAAAAAAAAASQKRRHE